MDITTANDSSEERTMISKVTQILSRHTVPIFTKKLIIDKNAIPHSHPVLTLNTRYTDDEPATLAVLVHEQLHWYFNEHPNRVAFLLAAKTLYEDLGDCNKSGSYPDSFWEHLAVIWNTYNIVKPQISEKQFEELYKKQWRPYPKTEPFVLEKYEEIKMLLAKHDMIYSELDFLS